MVATIIVVNDIYVVNAALAMCGLTETISSFDQVSPFASTGTYAYQQNKLACLTANEWNFCKGLKTLTLTGSEPDDKNYNYEYQVPVDMIQGGLRAVLDVSDTPVVDYTYSSANGYIWTNYTNVSAYYVKDVAEDQMPAYFVEWMISRLALKMIPSLELKDAKVQFVIDQEQKNRAIAFNRDADEEPAPLIQTRSSILDARTV